MAFKILSPDFQHDREIPSKFTCEGENISPEINWSGFPENTKSFSLIVDDPDAPDPAAPRMTFVHWVAYNIPGSVKKFPEKIPEKERIEGLLTSGINDYKKYGYRGPCPPIGRHRYYFKIYALDTDLHLKSGLTKNELLKEMEGHILAQTLLVGTYQKKK